MFCFQALLSLNVARKNRFVMVRGVSEHQDYEVLRDIYLLLGFVDILFRRKKGDVQKQRRGGPSFGTYKLVFCLSLARDPAFCRVVVSLGITN